VGSVIVGGRKWREVRVNRKGYREMCIESELWNSYFRDRVVVV
jgi:hypothetical protein